ncbi:MAG: hypothetical protein Q7U74_14955, partial [Saprospiraceae bacterium]|nr:hypothetical protein [Saprospiraceae bacterium]
AICLTVLDANLSGDRLPLNSTLSIEESGLGDRIQNQLRWQVHASRQVRSGWNESLLIRAVAGKQVEEGQKNIAQMLNLISPPEITLSPSWWRVIPLLPGRIMVVVQ